MSEIKRNVNYPTIETLTYEILQDIKRGFHTSVYVKEDKVDCIIKSILAGINDIKITYIDYDRLDYCNREYSITVDDFGDGRKELLVEPCWFEGDELHKAGYHNSECDTAFVDCECDSELLNHILANITVFEIKE